MNTRLWAIVKTAQGLSPPIEIETGLRQGGRFSTTGAKLALQHLNDAVRRVCRGIHIAYPDIRCLDLEFADDQCLLGDSFRDLRETCRVFSEHVRRRIFYQR